MPCRPLTYRVEGNEQADTYARAAASRADPCSDGEVLDGLLTEARSRASAEWIASHVRPGRRCRPPSGRGLRRQHLRSTRKELAGRYYQFLAGNGSFGPYPKRMKKVDSDRCRFCNTGERQSRFHLVARCPAWAVQARVMWKRIRRLCEKRGPVAPSVRAMFGDSRAAPAVLTFLRDTRVGKMASLSPRGQNWREGERDSQSEGEEAGPGPPQNVPFFSFLFLSSFLCPFCFLGALFFGWKGGRRDGDPTVAGSVGLQSWKTGYAKSHCRCCGSGGAAAMALRAACSGIANKRLHIPMPGFFRWENQETA